MKLAGVKSRDLMWPLRLLAAVLAVAGQLGLSGASLALARNESSTASHVEPNGIDLHRGHNEATCASCTALSFHAGIEAASPPLSSGQISRAVLVRHAVHYSTGAQLLSNSCRAPPKEV
jgi:hypothetical protein